MFENMQQREKVLLLGLIAVVGFMMARPLFVDTFLTPVRERKNALATATATLEQKQAEEYRFRLQQARLVEWRSTSLPKDFFVAQQLYKQWLEDLLKLSGIPSATVDAAGTRTRQARVYTPVPVAIKGEATFPQICKFLYHFHRTNLMHRIESLNIESDTNEGNPPMEFTLTAEGMSIADVPDRSRLFNETILAKDISREDTVIRVEDTEGFPRPVKVEGKQPRFNPFRIRVGTEYMTVTAVDGTDWTVQRGVDTTLPAAHAASATVELARVKSSMKDVNFTDYRKTLIARSPFLLPMDYDPTIEPIGEKLVIRGDELQFTPEISGFDPINGDPVFSLEDSDKIGITVDSQTGQVRWKHPAGHPAGKHAVTLRVTQSDAPEQVHSQGFTVAILEPNNPPVLETISEQTAFAGEPVKFQAKATDPDANHKLTFSLGDGAPSGAAVSETGRFEWTPESAAEAREYEFDLTVTDDGYPNKSATARVKITLLDDAARFTKLVASINNGLRPEAWLYDSANNRRIVLHEGVPFKLANIEGFVLTIGKDFVLVQIGAKTWRLELGDSLRDMKELTDQQTSLTNPAPESP